MKAATRVLAGAAAALALWATVPAGAANQTIDATIGSSVSMSTNPTSSISNWSLAATGANTTSGGSIGVTANTPYTVTVAADKTRLSEHDGSAYVSDGKTLTTALAVLTTLSGGTGVPVASLAVGTSAGTIATGVGLGTDTYAVTLSQTTAITDEPLSGSNTYRIVLTYTATAV